MSKRLHRFTGALPDLNPYWQFLPFHILLFRVNV